MSIKAVISTNYDPKYVFFMPIVAWCWNKLGVEVRFMTPYRGIIDEEGVYKVAIDQMTAIRTSETPINSIHCFEPPTDNHEVTYTQVSRLFAAADTQIPDDEILVTSDIDMAVFELPPHDLNGAFSIYGSDLVPIGQYPMCYAAATAKSWRETFVKGRTLQECLDDALAAENCENMRGNLWSRDQELLQKGIKPTNPLLFNRAKEGTQFAANRADRDNAYWYEDLIAGGKNIMDAHLWRPPYEEENFNKILKLLTIMYKNDNFDWLIQYREEFIKLL